MPNWGQLLGEDGGLPLPRVPGYTILELIGGHGQSEVYLAQDARGRRVALKRWKLPSPRAQLELEALQSLRVPGVVAVIGSAEDEALGLPCLIMEYVEAPHLLAEAPRLEARAAAAVVRDVARTLEAVHARALVHRDIKPANILLRPNGSVVLVDFGVVKAGPAGAGTGSAGEAPLTLTGAGPIGTLPYMAPEQLELCEDPVGPQADVYALGATLYQCLTGAVPYETNGAFERRERQVWRDPPAGAELEGVPPQLQRIVSACLAFRPDQRPAGAAAVAAALEDFLAGRSDGRGRGLYVLSGLAAASLVLAGVALASARRAAPSPTPPPTRVSPSPSPDVAPAQSLVLQPGPYAGRDTFVSSVGLYTNDNFGPSPSLRVGFRGPQTGQAGEYRSLLAFDLGRLPPGAELLSAELELRSLGPNLGPGPERVEARPVLPSGPRTPWLEGTGRIDRLLDGVAWSGVARTRHPAANSDLPARSLPEVGPLASAAQVTSGHLGWVRLDLSQCVRRWLAEPASNLGLVLQAPSDPQRGHWRFASSDAPEAESRPRLRLRYRGAPPLPAPAPDARSRRARAERELAEAARARGRGDPLGAYQAATRAAVAAPEWGRPYYERALLTPPQVPAMVRVDVTQAMWAAEPEPRVEALRLLAEANLRESGAASRQRGLVLLAALACDPDQGESAAARFAEAYPKFRAQDLGRAAAREAALQELSLLLSTRARLETRPAPGELALTLALALVCEAEGDARALSLYREARSMAPEDSLLLALEGGRERTSGRAEAARIRLELALGRVAAARRRWRRASSRWPRDPALRPLASLLDKD